MKKLLPLLLLSQVALAGPLGFGVKGGVPMTDMIDSVSSGDLSLASATKRYTIGPTVEIRLPFGFGVEADFLYKRTSIELVQDQSGETTTEQKSATSLEFPLLGKYRLPGDEVRPYVAAGVSFRHLSDLKAFVTGEVRPHIGVDLSDLKVFVAGEDPASRGFVMAGGIQFKLGPVRLSPELRWTRWGSGSGETGVLKYNRNQAEFLVGITF